MQVNEVMVVGRGGWVHRWLRGHDGASRDYPGRVVQAGADRGGRVQGPSWVSQASRMHSLAACLAAACGIMARVHACLLWDVDAASHITSALGQHP